MADLREPPSQSRTAAVDTARPDSLAALRDAVRDTAPDQLLIRGAGTATDWAGPPTGVATVVETTGLDQVLSYRSADMTVAVQAGTPLATLQELLASNGQRVAYDAARVPLGSTVGGLFATADAGPLRHAHGSLRDLVIGIVVVLADGTVAHSGGHVIKNVAGYDLGKLFHGSYGALGVTAELVLRLHPTPATSRTVIAPCGPGAGFDLASRILKSSLEPSALEWHSSSSVDGRLLARIEGGASSVRRRAAAAARLAGALSADSMVCSGDEEAAVWRQVAEVSVGETGDTVLRVGTLPSRFPDLARRLQDLATRQGVTAAVTSSVGIGVHTVRVRGGGRPEAAAAAHADVVTALRADIAAHGGATTLCRRRDGVTERASAWGPPPAALAVLRAVKQAFDPTGRIGPGRFTPWF